MATGKRPSRQAAPQPSSMAAPKSHRASRPRRSPPGLSPPEACLKRGDVIAAWAAFERVLTSMEIGGAADINAQLRYARRAGSALQEFGDTRGNREALLGAAALFRRAISYGIDVGVTQLHLGNTLVRLAYQQNSVALTKEAQVLFETALAEISASSNHAALLRAKLNCLETQYLLGKYTKNLPAIDDCVQNLEIVISELPETGTLASPDRARAEAVLGNALVARYGLSQNRESDLAAALNAYRRAIRWSNDPSERARIEIDLATALVESGDYITAIDTVETSLPEKYTVIWANSQTVLADARRMLAESVNSSQPAIAKDHLAYAIGAYEEILDADQEWPPVIRGGTRTRLASALVLLTGLDPAAGEHSLRRAIDLYNDAIPDLPYGEEKEDIKSKLTELCNNIGRHQVNDTIMDKVAIIQAATQLLSRVYPAEHVGKALEDLETAATERETRATAELRPRWPDDALPYEIDSPPHFAARVYGAEAEAGTLHRGLIGQEDRARGTKLASTLSNWLRTHPWPADVPYIPTKPEWMTQQVEAATKEGKPLRAPRSDEAKLRDAARYRASKTRNFSC